MSRRFFWLWASLAALPAAGCGSASVVKPPDKTVNVSSLPAKTLDEPIKSNEPAGTAADPPSKTPPPIKAYAPEELQRVVATLANDDPGDRPTRVWIRNDPSHGPAVDVVLSNSLISDDGLAKLAGIAHLRHLNLDDCREITTAGLAHLAALKELRKLSLNHTAVDDAGLAHLPSLRGLAELSLVGNLGVTDAGAAHVARCGELKLLRLKDTRLTDKGLAELHALKQLREIWLEGTRVSEQGIAALEIARPGIRVVHPLRPAKRGP